MKKILPFVIAVFITTIANAQTPIYEYLFNGNLLSTGSQTGATATLTSYTATPAVTYVQGRDGTANSAVRMSSYNYLLGTLTALPVGTSARTIMFWVKQNAASATTSKVEYFAWGATTYGQSFGMFTSNTTATNNTPGTVSVSSGSQSGTTTNDIFATVPSPGTGVWSHFAAVYDGTTVTVYRNGNQIISQAASWNTVGTSFKLNAGVFAGSGGIAADFDNVQIYNTALTSAQVQASFGGTSAAPVSPVYSYQFNGTLTDATNANAFTGAATYTMGRSGYVNTAVQLGSNPLTAALSNVPAGGNARTISVWVKFPAQTSNLYKTIFMYGAGTNSAAYGLTERVNFTNTYNLANNGFDSDFTLPHETPITATNWIHYAVVYNAGCPSVYRNGEFLGSGSEYLWSTINSTFYLGSWLDGTSNLTQAAYDDLEIYNVALTPNQVAGLYTKTSVVPVGATTSIAPTNGLVAYYPFESNLNSHNGLHNLSTSSTMTYATGKYGNGLTLSGQVAPSNALSLSQVLQNDKFTISFWAKLTSTGQPTPTVYPSFFEKYGSAYGRFDRTSVSNNLTWGYSNTATAFPQTNNSSVALLDGIWKHYTIVHDVAAGINYRMYVDGTILSNIPNTAGSLPLNIYRFNTMFYVGGGSNSAGVELPSKRLYGQIDEFYIYDRALTAQEINDVKNNAGALILPVTLSSFTANLTNKTTQLNWATSQETNTSHFEIEYSNNGKDFEKVASVAANGNIVATQNYIAYHTVDVQAKHYYRLKMIDKDGKYTYSSILVLVAKIESIKFEIFPTIVQQAIKLQIVSSKKEEATLKVVNNIGQIVLLKKIQIIDGTQLITENINQLQSGFYIATLNTKSIVLTQRFIKK